MQYRSLATIISSGVIGLASAIPCSPAPLTQRPGVPAEYLRPHVVPLEESFADAQSVKRSLVYRASRLAMENR